VRGVGDEVWVLCVCAFVVEEVPEKDRRYARAPLPPALGLQRKLTNGTFKRSSVCNLVERIFGLETVSLSRQVFFSCELQKFSNRVSSRCLASPCLLSFFNSVTCKSPLPGTQQCS
jgi:hypothetical protein